MLRYFIMKKKEIELKLKLYTFLLAFIHSKEEIIELISKLTVVLQDVPADEFRNQLIESLAELIHEQNLKEDSVHNPAKS